MKEKLSNSLKMEKLGTNIQKNIVWFFTKNSIMIHTTRNIIQITPRGHQALVCWLEKKFEIIIVLP